MADISNVKTADIKEISDQLEALSCKCDDGCYLASADTWLFRSSSPHQNTVRIVLFSYATTCHEVGDTFAVHVGGLGEFRSFYLL